MVKEYEVPGMGWKVIHHACVDSTNEVAKRAGDLGAVHGTVFWADRQNAGKGRRGRSWYSEETGNLYFSILLRPDFSPRVTSMLTLLMAYVVAKVIGEETKLNALIKWPNDIVVNEKKVCGILSEMKLNGSKQEYCVIGVGINVMQKQFPQDLRDLATSLYREAVKSIEKEMLLHRILTCFQQEYERFLVTKNLTTILEPYNDMLVNMDRQVRVLDPKGEYEGIARGVTETGELLVETGDGQYQKVYAGEVSVRGLYGYV